MKKKYWLLFLLLGVLLAPPGWAQTPGTVTGTVTSATDKSPLPGVTVLVKGTTVGSTTAADGRYAVQAAPGAVLVFSFIGYSSQERTVGAAGSVDVALAETTTGLDEVVVTAERRSDTLQNVPVTVSAFSAASLEARQIRSLSSV